MFPDFLKNLHAKNIIDFGCGTGNLALALAKYGAGSVLGIDINPKSLERARKLLEEYQLEHKVSFAERLDGTEKDRFDAIISVNSMEHYTDPVEVLKSMKSAIKNNGHIYITFGPPWFAPYGSHMHFFTKMPWVNIIFSEKTVMNVRGNFRNDGAKKYGQVESGLNKMTIAKFERLVASTRLKVIYLKYDCVKGINFLRKIPLIRELFINHVTCILRS